MMGYTYPEYGAAKPFVPASINFPKKRAKQLQQLLENVPLSLAQETIAKALGWKDWFAMQAAIQQGATPSKLDEEVGEDERNKRWSTQFNAIHDCLKLRLPDPEFIVADLALTCTAPTAAKRRDEVGPWGRFQETPREIAPGILLGQCAKFECYRLTPDRQAQIRKEWQLDTNGWYMCDDHAWRVVLSLPEVFTQEEQDSARRSMREYFPSLYELMTGEAQEGLGFVPIRLREAYARSNPDAWFMISVFEDWTFPKAETESKYSVVSAVRGADLLRLIASCGVWPTDGSITPGWFAMRTHDICDFLDGVLDPEAVPYCISGLSGYAHPPVCALPYKRQVFDDQEIEIGSCSGYVPLVDAIVPGEAGLIA